MASTPRPQEAEGSARAGGGRPARRAHPSSSWASLAAERAPVERRVSDGARNAAGDERTPLAPNAAEGKVEATPGNDYVNTFGFIMSVLKVIVGKGMLAHAYAYRLVGYEMFFIDVFVFATAFFQVLILKAALNDGETSIWDAVERSLGKRGCTYWQGVLLLGRSSTLVMVLSVMGGCVQELLHLDVRVETIEPGASYTKEVFAPVRLQILMFCALCCVPTALTRYYSVLQYFSAIGVAACVSIFLVFLTTYVHGEHSRASTPTDMAGGFYNIPLVIGMSMYVSAGGDPSIADVILRHTRSEPSKHSCSEIALKIGVAFVVGFVVVVSFALGCYRMYGESTQPNVVHNLGADPASQGLVSPALVLLFVNGICSFGLLGNVVFLRIEDMTGWDPNTYRLCMVVAFLLGAIFIPNVATLITISGCFIQGQYKFVLPPLLYIADYYHTSRTRGPLANPRADPVTVIGASMLLFIGVALFLIGSLRIFL
jgi:hypothetical protein